MADIFTAVDGETRNDTVRVRQKASERPSKVGAAIVGAFETAIDAGAAASDLMTQGVLKEYTREQQKLSSAHRTGKLKGGYTELINRAAALKAQYTTSRPDLVGDFGKVDNAIYGFNSTVKSRQDLDTAFEADINARVEKQQAVAKLAEAYPEDTPEQLEHRYQTNVRRVHEVAELQFKRTKLIYENEINPTRKTLRDLAASNIGIFKRAEPELYKKAIAGGLKENDPKLQDMADEYVANLDRIELRRKEAAILKASNESDLAFNKEARVQRESKNKDYVTKVNGELATNIDAGLTLIEEAGRRLSLTEVGKEEIDTFKAEVAAAKANILETRDRRLDSASIPEDQRETEAFINRLNRNFTELEEFIELPAKKQERILKNLQEKMNIKSMDGALGVLRLLKTAGGGVNTVEALITAGGTVGQEFRDKLLGVATKAFSEMTEDEKRVPVILQHIARVRESGALGPYEQMSGVEAQEFVLRQLAIFDRMLKTTEPMDEADMRDFHSASESIQVAAAKSFNTEARGNALERVAHPRYMELFKKAYPSKEQGSRGDRIADLTRSNAVSQLSRVALDLSNALGGDGDPKKDRSGAPVFLEYDPKANQFSVKEYGNIGGPGRSDLFLRSSQNENTQRMVKYLNDAMTVMGNFQEYESKLPKGMTENQYKHLIVTGLPGVKVTGNLDIPDKKVDRSDLDHTPTVPESSRMASDNFVKQIRELGKTGIVKLDYKRNDT